MMGQIKRIQSCSGTRRACGRTKQDSVVPAADPEEFTHGATVPLILKWGHNTYLTMVLEKLTVKLLNSGAATS